MQSKVKSQGDSPIFAETKIGTVPENSKQLVRQTLEGLPTCRAVSGPLAVHSCAHRAGISLRDYTLNARVMADCVLHYYEAFRPDAIWLSADTWVAAEAMGAEVAFPAGDQPLAGTGKACVRTAADIDRIPPPDPFRQGRMPLMLEAMRLIDQAVGRDVFLVACFDQYPFSLACALMGIERVMTSLADDRSVLEKLMGRCIEYSSAYALAFADAGADMLSGGDSPAGLIGPRSYREIALPFEQRLIAQIKSKTSKPVSLHICGNATPILADMAASGADVLELDYRVDLAAACQAVGPNIGIWGTLDPVGLLVQSTPEQVRQATVDLMRVAQSHGHRRFVVSSGCTLAPDTPDANLNAMLDAVRTSGNTMNSERTK